jgi:hypothetical protein
MRMKPSVALLAVCCAIAVAGCGSSDNTAVQEKTVREPLRLGEKIDVSLQELLTKPRKELAGLADDLHTKIEFQDRALREGRLQFYLLPKLRFPLVIPIWREAKYSDALHFSLPVYAAENAKDSSLAFHLARYGDSEAANGLVETSDAPALQKILADASDRCYPAEWTRLVALLFQTAEIRLAAGEVEGATELVFLHQQLRPILDAKAAKTALGAALLSRGFEVLALASSAWRADKQTEIADQIDAALKEWGDRPTATPVASLGRPRPEIGRILKDGGHGRAAIISPPTRALDLFELAFPLEGSEAYVAFFDESEHLAEAWLTYGESARARFREPADLAYRLNAERSAGSPNSPDFTLPGAVYTSGGVEYDIAYPPPGAGVGAIVRIISTSKRSISTALSREFGTVNLDRSFEQNRLMLLPELRKDVLTLNQPQTLSRLISPMPVLKPDEVVIRKEAGHNLVAGLRIRYPVGSGGAPPLHQLLGELWKAAGPPSAREAHQENGNYLAFGWHDPRTSYSVYLPFIGSEPLVFEGTDVEASNRPSGHEARALAFDRKERSERIRAGKMLTRVPRALDQVELGMTRAQVEKVLPGGKNSLRQTIPDGLTVTLFGDPPDSEPFTLRQLFIRFDKSDRVAEIRCRYDDGDDRAGNRDWAAEMLNGFRKQAGAPLPAPPPWLRISPGAQAKKPEAIFCSWHDDASSLGYQRDSAGVEVCLRDCPPDHPDGLPLPPLEYLARGTENCHLRMTQSEMLREWKIEKPQVTPDGALVLRPPAMNAMDVILVWFDKGRAARIVARHRPDNVKRTSPAQWAEALTLTWRRDFPALGWPQSHDSTKNAVLQSLVWYDEETSVQMFWQESDGDQVYLYTEWKDLAAK